MARKVIIDCDPGIDDAVGLCLALFEPRVEVLAVTAVEGTVSAKQASRNVQAIIEWLDPPRLPRIGTASPPDRDPGVSGDHLHGNDGLGNAELNVSRVAHQHPSYKIICDIVRAHPNEVTVVCLGPLTNVARAFQRDPSLVGMVARLIMMGGSVDGLGNITPVAEFNIYYDPASAHAVFGSATTKTLVPLDVTRQVRITMDFVDDLPGDSTRAGNLLRRVIPFAFRAYHQQLGQESIFLNDVIALLAALHPELFETTYLAGDVETTGTLTMGATVFDRRPNPEWRNNMEVAIDVDETAALDCILRGLAHAGRCT